MKTKLSIDLLKSEAASFAMKVSKRRIKELYGRTDGKAVGTYVEHQFQEHLDNQYDYERGSSAKGIDFPGLKVDMKVTSIRQPQSSSPFKSAHQKVRGLGYALLVFVYDKKDIADEETEESYTKLTIVHAVFIEESATADHALTREIKKIVTQGGSAEEIIALMRKKDLPISDSDARTLAEELLDDPPDQGHLTISNALQWRLQYKSAISAAGEADGVTRIL